MPKHLKSYPATWDGELLLACRKCQKKLKDSHSLRVVAKLKKTIKHLNKEHPDAPLHVINVPCMDLCPKNGVTICRLAEQPARLSILRSEGDLLELFCYRGSRD